MTHAGWWIKSFKMAPRWGFIWCAQSYLNGNDVEASSSQEMWFYPAAFGFSRRHAESRCRRKIARKLAKERREREDTAEWSAA